MMQSPSALGPSERDRVIYVARPSKPPGCRSRHLRCASISTLRGAPSPTRRSPRSPARRFDPLPLAGIRRGWNTYGWTRRLAGPPWGSRRGNQRNGAVQPACLVPSSRGGRERLLDKTRARFGGLLSRDTACRRAAFRPRVEGSEAEGMVGNSFGCLFSFRDGRISRVKEYATRDEALQAARLRE
jgi:hypothetical protein